MKHVLNWQYLPFALFVMHWPFFTRVRSDFVAVLGTEFNSGGMDDSAALGSRAM
jgi:hypothetical protein